MDNFNPNNHSTEPLKVWVKRLNTIAEVSEVKILNERNIVWGFAKVGEELVEFDTSWGDKIGIDL